MEKQSLATRENEANMLSQEQSVIAVRAGNDTGHFWRAVGLIIKREYKNQVTQRSFIISTIIMLVLLVIAACVPTAIEYFASSTPPAQTKIVVLNNAGSIGGLSGDALTKHLETSLNEASARISAPGQPAAQPYTVISAGPATPLDDVQQQIKDGKLQVALVIDRSASGDLSFTQYTKTADAGSAALPQLGDAAMQLNLLDKGSSMNLTPEQAQSLTIQPEVNTIALQQEQNSRSVAERVAGYVIAYVGIILISLCVFLYGNTVAQGVAEEKGGRIMEILMNAATPFQLMVGKILGIGAAALTQIATFVIVTIGAILLQGAILRGLFFVAVDSRFCTSGSPLQRCF